MEDLTERRTGTTGVPVFYGTVPPREGTPKADVRSVAEGVAARLEDSDVDAILVYDVQDEEGRNDEPRPFPFIPTIASRQYAALLREATGRTVVCYKAAPAHSGNDFQEWLQETRRTYGIRYLSLVGRSSSDTNPPGPSLETATRMATALTEPGFGAVGGVAIPERHPAKGDEGRRLLQKTERGMRYFVSQIIYRPDAAARMLRAYDRRCKEHGMEPALVALTFAPCGHRKTLRFMRWLGVDVPAGAEERIFSADNPVETSVRLCQENLARIVERTSDLTVPVGITAESVSIRRDEIDASVELLAALQNEFRERIR
jgi:5,10-methylenetetrahydrofolate reductase